MRKGQYQCNIEPHIERCEKLPNPELRSHSIVFNVTIVFAGYVFYDKVDTFELAFQMKSDMEERFKILEKAE